MIETRVNAVRFLYKAFKTFSVICICLYNSVDPREVNRDGVSYGG